MGTGVLFSEMFKGRRVAELFGVVSGLVAVQIHKSSVCADHKTVPCCFNDLDRDLARIIRETPARGVLPMSWR
jgi:hypothetical protein